MSDMTAASRYEVESQSWWLQDWMPAAAPRPKRQRLRRGSPKADTDDTGGGSAAPSDEDIPSLTAPRAAAQKAAAVHAALSAATVAAPAAAPAKVQPVISEEQMAATAGQLAAIESAPDRPAPGSMLLTRDPADPAKCAFAF